MWEYRHVGDYPYYLMHYGVKGMKWGVRRTPEQLGNFSKNKSYDINNMDRKTLLKLTNSGEDFILSKGQMLSRATNNPNEIRSARTYVSARGSEYIGNMDSIGGTYKKAVYDVKYKTKDDMKVAGYKTQVRELLKLYGDDRYKEINFKTTLRDLDDLLQRDKDRSVDLDILMNDTPMRSKYIDRLRKKGYDACMDLVDGMDMAFMDGPMVAINNDKLERKSTKKVFDPDQGGWLE